MRPFLTSVETAGYGRVRGRSIRTDPPSLCTAVFDQLRLTDGGWWRRVWRTPKHPLNLMVFIFLFVAALALRDVGVAAELLVHVERDLGGCP